MRPTRGFDMLAAGDFVAKAGAVRSVMGAFSDDQEASNLVC